MRSAALLALGAVIACSDATRPTALAPDENVVASLSFPDGSEVRQNANGTATIFAHGKAVVTVPHAGGLRAPSTIAGMFVADDPCMFDAAYDALSGNCNTPPTLNGGAGTGGGGTYTGCTSCGDQLAKYLASGWAAGMTTSQLLELAAGASPYAVAALGGAWVYVGYLLWKYYQCYTAYQACLNSYTGGGGSTWNVITGREWP